MTRRQEMTEDGETPCGLCKQWLHITEFYTKPVKGDTPSKDIWWGDPVTGKQYGQPKSYCRACNRETTRGRNRFHNYMMLVESRNETRIHDLETAWYKAHQENARRKYDAEHPPA
jgi:hypothetical protein